MHCALVGLAESVVMEVSAAVCGLPSMFPGCLLPPGLDMKSGIQGMLQSAGANVVVFVCFVHLGSFPPLEACMQFR